MSILRPIFRWTDGVFTPMQDEIVEEVPLTLVVNGREILTLMSLGENLEELSVGFLRSEGFLSKREQLLSVKVEEGRALIDADIDLDLLLKISEKRTITTGCGKGTVFHSPMDALTLKKAKEAHRYQPGAILLWMRELEGRSDLFKRTGGVHNAALCSEERILYLRTDIGRHNAVDMLCGRAFLDGLALEGLALAVSGRISSEILRKTAALGVELLVSRSAPTTLALDMAQTLGITVVGYARAGRFNVYTHPGRLTWSDNG